MIVSCLYESLIASIGKYYDDGVCAVCGGGGEFVFLSFLVVS
jgi:hypothetical protein